LFEHLLRDRKLSIPVVLNHQADESDPEEALVRFARDTGGLVADGCGDAVFIQTEAVHPDQAARWGYGVLQASRARISKTDFISCPSCGRTLFDLQTTTERIRSKMGHLKGVKVAIMGCIVNGPGEMADADFGYVGWGPGKINLYVGKECVERNIPEHEADQRLIELIKRHGRWIEPPAGVLTAGDTLAPQSEGAQP
jgi:(E)-4-hydroxy-3-methylbut-2-enyl-diphosphate synthase